MDTPIEKKFSNDYGFLESKYIDSRTDWRKVRKMLDNNIITKIKRGVYRLNTPVGNDQRVELAKLIPEGVFCMFSAWQYYNLSLYNPFECYMAIEKSKKITLPTYPPVKLYYWIEKNYLLGITEIDIDNQKVKIYDLEKSVCDAVRFRNKIGMDTTIEILQNYVKRQDKNLNKLSRYAQQLRIENIINNMIMILL
jgi:predicted transcriptional regulator of viral defense system